MTGKGVRETDRQTDYAQQRDLPFNDLIPKWPQQLGLVQAKAKARSQKLHSGIPHEW